MYDSVFVRRVKPVVLHNAVATLPSPTPVTIEASPPIERSFADTLLSFDSNGVNTLSNVRLYGRFDGKTRLVGRLNGGADIELTADLGYEERIQAAEWDRAWVEAGVAGAGTEITITLWGEEVR